MLANSPIDWYNIRMEQEINTNEPEIKIKEEVITPSLDTKVDSGKKLTMPGAIIIAGVIIALAIIFSGGGIKNKKSTDGKITIEEASSLRELSPIVATEHLRGDFKKAKIAIVEFSDLECPYCRQLHPTMQQVLEVYGSDVVLIYRHFPLESIHAHARPAAIASECVNELAGNDGFWKFIDGVFTYSGSGTAFDPANMETIVKNSGVTNMDAFNTCISSGKYDKSIDDSITDANNAGAQGTPDLTAVNLETGEAVHIGADPSLLGQVLDKMLKK